MSGKSTAGFGPSTIQVSGATLKTAHELGIMREAGRVVAGAVDGALSCHVGHTVAVTEDGPEILIFQQKCD